jgi:hypothetical protein
MIGMKNYQPLLSGIIIIFSIWAAFAPPIRAQLVCSITKDQDIGGYTDSYIRLHCQGNDCIVIADAIIVGEPVHSVFLRSVDGGHNWTLQDPGKIDTTAELYGVDLIDSSNIIAYGDGGGVPGIPYFTFILRTTDGGATWLRDSTPTNDYTIEDVSFSSSKDGMLASADSLFITSDGGAHWGTVPDIEVLIRQCHDYGNGMYRGYSWSTQQIFTTTNFWKTYDTTPSIGSDHIYYSDCRFGGGDTIFAYGFRPTSSSINYPCIARTTDAGHHWSSVYDDTTGPFGYIYSMSDVDRDTIAAGINSSLNTALWSTDNGVTWKVDSLQSDDTSFNVNEIDGIDFNSEGELVGAFNYYPPPSTGGSLVSFLVIGKHVNAGVSSNVMSSSPVEIFPNPASTTVNIIAPNWSHSIHLIDILGRDAMTGMSTQDGQFTLDVSHLPHGIYSVLLDRDGALLPVGKIAVEGK